MMVLAGCSLGSPAQTLPVHTPTPAQSSPELQADDSSNGLTVHLNVRQTLLLTLGSTYWQVNGSSDPAVLQQLGEPAVSAQPSQRIPGLGLGTVSARFRALTAGSAQVTAQRSTCGEALACRPDQRSFVLTVQVS